ncbi:hypothetical protein MMC25_001140 [Agyrium rufum]|nr:hypothetical protein [Agyrium rufum]
MDDSGVDGITPMHSEEDSRPRQNAFMELLNAHGPITIPQIDTGSAEYRAARAAVLAEIDQGTIARNSEPSTLPSRGASNGRHKRGRGNRRTQAQSSHPTPVVAQQVDSTQEVTVGPVTSVRGRGSRGGRVRGTRGSRGTTRGSRRGSVRGGRGGAKVGKRKRGLNDDEEDNALDSDTSENFTPLDQSRSGRRIIHTNASVPTIKIEQSRTSLSTISLSSSNTKAMASSTKKDKSKEYRRPPGASAVCAICGRGASPASNVIVFCDDCNKPWHQYCHDPPIRGGMEQIEAQDWFCAKCHAVREDRAALTGMQPPGELTYSEKRERLGSLSKSRLISLLMHASSVHTELALFPPSALPISDSRVQAEASTVRSDPATVSLPENTFTTAIAATVDGLSANDAVEPEDGLVYYESEPLPYPKAGNGIQLQPEEDVYEYLIDDSFGAGGVYSHMSWGPEGERGIGRAELLVA